MPHVVYLHSALQTNRIPAADKEERRTLLRYNRWDCIIGLGIAGFVNLSMLCIAAALFHKPGLEGVSDLGPSTPTRTRWSAAAPRWPSASR